MVLITTFIDAWRNRDKLGDQQKTRELAAFLPAVLEIQETPPNPLARYLTWSLVGLVFLGVAWASWGKVNIVASAEGKIIPSSRVKVVQPSAGGVIKHIWVSEGERVAQGQPLIELDSALTMADSNRLEGDIQSLEQMIAVNRTMIERLNLPIDQQDELSSVGWNYSQTTGLHTALLQQQWRQYWSQLQGLNRSLDKVRAEQAMTREVIIKLEQTLPIATQRAEKLHALLGQAFVSETEYLAAEKERIQITQDLAAEKQRVGQIAATEAEIREQIETHTAQTHANLLSTLADQERQLASLQEELAKANDLNNRRILYAPVSGQIQQMQVSTLGGVVTDAQQLMLIVPDEEKLEVEVFLKNDDIGYVTEGMAAEIKVHTFPFTKYGVVDAEIVTVSNDAIVDEERGLIYSMLLRMERNTLIVDGRETPLIPGMAVTAEVQTGERRIIEFFLAPLLRHKQEALRER